MDKKWLSYWKKSLSDSLKGEIEVSKSIYFEIENFDISNSSLFDLKKINNIINAEEDRINKKKSVSDKNSKNWVVIEAANVLISPMKLAPISEHQVYLGGKKAIFPFWYRATLNRQGELSIPEDVFPVFQRKLLEPLIDEKTEFVFASVEDVDNAACIGKESYQDYSEYINYVRKIFQTVGRQPLEEYTYSGYKTVYNGIILLPDEEINAAINIIPLYEKILKEKELPALLKHFITLNHTSEKSPFDVSEFIELNDLHVGQMGDTFPISISQRKSLYTFLESKSKIFAVNGPPGTGKTTLLQSVVANKMVENAIRGGSAPVILACSTNNQAVTNIIESFSKSNTQEGVLKGRWLPEIDGYATYLPSESKDDVALKGINYKKPSGDGLFKRVENKDYLEDAKKEFLQKSAGYFHMQYINIEEVVHKLRNEIINIQSALKDASCKWKNYLDAEKTFTTVYLKENNDGVKNYYSEDDILYELPFDDDISDFTKLEGRIIDYFKNESFFRRLFCTLNLKSAIESRAIEIRIILRDTLICITPDFTFKKNSILELINHKITIAKSIKQSINAWKSWKKQYNIKGNPPKTEKQYWDFEYLKRLHKIISNCFYDELDVTVRHKAFQLALHYWEGRWLLKLEEDLQSQFDKKDIETTKNRWQRQAMVTPCFVSTFYMAPKFFSAFRFLAKGENGKKIYDEIPLYNFIDLLIVDEAGQVSPEVGTATFALAKQAIVVGDVKQIEPVWNILENVDIGNLKQEKLIRDYNDPVYKKMFEKGFLASSGNIMKMAQNASDFKEPGLNGKGITLVEHRRCYDEIISYCNDLAYNGQLKPLRGKAKNDVLFPPMYCIHVEGSSMPINGSRSNPTEAKAIVDWICTNKIKIEAKYGKKVEDSVGIITPFVGQKNILRDGLKHAGFDVSKIKLGTVHALQGGERPIILFSMVYGKGDTGTMFFDRDNKPNMLNVAVSRAQDNFIVFANTNILDKTAKTPSGVLANHLVYQ
ncbi:MAG: hypothetical protein LBT94_06405 [Prevotellaceae bacterium]|jgi:Cdc6-like AAA superfamily ATPase|nr:hypothetical protein [Prevotellaceae bacterium]